MPLSGRVGRYKCGGCGGLGIKNLETGAVDLKLRRAAPVPADQPLDRAYALYRGDEAYYDRLRDREAADEHAPRDIPDPPGFRFTR